MRSPSCLCVYVSVPPYQLLNQLLFILNLLSFLYNKSNKQYRKVLIHSFIIHPLCLVIGIRHVNKIHNCLNISMTLLLYYKEVSIYFTYTNSRETKY
jgi:hypothetical protein